MESSTESLASFSAAEGISSMGRGGHTISFASSRQALTSQFQMCLLNVGLYFNVLQCDLVGTANQTHR